MRQLIDKILRPERKQLIYFGIFISPILIFGLYIISFAWIPGFSSLLKAIYVLLLFIFIVTVLHDRYNNTKLKYYVYVTVVLFTTYALVSFPTRDFLKSKTQEQGARLGVFVENYRVKTGRYPEDFSDDFFKNAPKRSYIGTQFSIDTYIDTKENDTICHLKYHAFDGYIGSYNTQTREWHYYD